MAAEPFTIDVPQQRLDEIMRKVRDHHFREDTALPGWEFGTSLEFMKRLRDYWLEQYDWRAAERELNRFRQFRAEVDGQLLHFVHERGSGSSPKTLLLIHGWPGSFYEFYASIEKLTYPERFGGDPEDGFDVVVPALPGYGFSGRPARPIGCRDVARLFDLLMTETLGYEHYIAEGGDWGAFISGWLGLDHAPACEAVHLTTVGLRPEGAAFFEVSWSEEEFSEDERAFLAAERDLHYREGAYFMTHASRPQTLSYAMEDSPVGAAAWILEKFHQWSNHPRGESVDELFTLDQLLTNVMIYLVSGSMATATWIYNGYAENDPKFLPRGERIEVPTGLAAFPDPMVPPPPRSIVERVFNIVHWSDMASGAHFAAFEEPDLFVEDVRAFGRLLRSGRMAVPSEA